MSYGSPTAFGMTCDSFQPDCASHLVHSELHISCNTSQTDAIATAAGGATTTAAAGTGSTGDERATDPYPGFEPSPASRARMIAWARSATCSLAKMFETWLRTVLGLR